MSFQTELETLKANIVQQRDELQLQLGLAKLEARDEWHEVEAKVVHFMTQLEEVGEETTEEVKRGAHQLGTEIKQAYEKLKTSVQ